jgi:LPXTG-motif cell wall-anchored protein
MQGRRGELDRRDVLKRAALVGGATVWVTPVIQSLSGSAWAATSGSEGVEGTKTPASDTDEGGPEVLGQKIPHTGSANVTELVAAGTGLVLAGAAAVTVAKHQRGKVAADGPPVAKHRRKSVPGDDA